MVFISGCDKSDKTTDTQIIRNLADYDLKNTQKAWLRDHLPNGTVAYLNLPTPWNYLFDAKADAMHGVQSLSAHKEQVEKIKHAIKDNYSQYIPAHYQDLTLLFIDHMVTSLEVAVINHSETAMLPTLAFGTRLKNLSQDDLLSQFTAALHLADSSIELEQQDDFWAFKAGKFPAYLRYDESSGRLLIFGGLGASKDKMSSLWNEEADDQLKTIKMLSNDADPSGLNMKMWLAPARMYQIGGSFVPPEQQQLITEYGFDQLEYLWFGFESSQGQSALAMHMVMPDVGWRLALPKAVDWFDIELAGQPRSVVQLTLPTADQVQSAIEHFKLKEKLTENNQKDLKGLDKFKETFGFEPLDLLRIYHQQMYWVKDDSGSWIAMKIKDPELNDKIEAKIYEFFSVNPEKKTLANQEIWQAHFSIYHDLLESAENKPADSDKYSQLMGIFKDHVYWYLEDDVFYMSTVPQVLAEKRNHKDPIKLSDWLAHNQGSDWESAILAFGKDVKHMPQDMYHFYLLMLQTLADLAQTNIDLFALPTASELNLPDSGRINLTLSSDAEKVSLKLGYEYSFIEGILNGEGGMTTVAVVAILASYAIPAYRDYMIRAQVSAQLNLTSGLKVMVSEYWYNHETFEGLAESLDEIDGLVYYIDNESGTITIDLDGVTDDFMAGDEVYLEPSITEYGVEWQCYSSISSRYLPQSCR